MADREGGAPSAQCTYPGLPVAAARAWKMSKDYLDRTLEHDPDRGSDPSADLTLNRDPAKKPDRKKPDRKSAVDAIEASKDSKAPPDPTVELRSEQRVEVIVPIEMQVAIEVPGTGRIAGATENMSGSGMLARLNGPVQRDSRCRVNFLSAADVEPNQVFGRVTRVAKSRFGYSVAFRFERPVRLKVTPPPRKQRT